MRKKLAIAVPLVLVLVAIVAIATGAFKSDEPAPVPGEFNDESYPFTFSYPPEWSVSQNPSFQFGAGSAKSTVAVQLAPPENQVVVSEYSLSRSLAPGENAPEAEIQAVVDDLEEQTNGRASQLKVVRYADAPGYEYVLRFRDETGKRLQSRIVYLFKGQSEYEVNCQSDRDGRAATNTGCSEVLDSLSITNSP